MQKRIKYISFIFALLQGACLLAQKAPAEPFAEDSVRYYIAPVEGINTPASEFAPYLLGEQLIYVSDEVRVPGVKFTNEAKSALTDIYAAKKKDSVQFTNKGPWLPSLNTFMNEGPASFNSAGTIMIFSSNADFESGLHLSIEKGLKNLQLFICFREGESWSRPKRMDFCRKEISYTHPALSSDGKTLYFASDMKGGKGGMDIYYCISSGGGWTAPFNAGDRINTADNEVFPSISPDSILYFSSRRKDGLGGLDIYRAVMKEGAQTVELLGAPFNSTADDFGMFSTDGKSGYLSSSRNGNDDIFFFRDLHPGFEKHEQYIEPEYCFQFSEESGETLLQGNEDIALTYEWSFGDGHKARGLDTKHCFSKPGNYNIELNIIEENSGALFYNETSYDLLVADSFHIYMRMPDTVTAGERFLISSEGSVTPGKQLTSFKWDLGDGRFTQGSAGSTSFRETGSYTIRLLVTLRDSITGGSESRCFSRKIQVAAPGWELRQTGHAPVADTTLSQTAATQKRHITDWEIRFRDRQFTIDRSCLETMDSICSALTTDLKLALFIEGQEISGEHKDYQKMLIEKRTAAIRKYLHDKGIAETRVVQLPLITRSESGTETAGSALLKVFLSSETR